MTPGAANTPYVEARLHARQGARADERTWTRLSAYEDYRGYLQALQGTPLSGFATHLAVDADAHAVEAELRAVWRAYVAEIAAWHGPAFAEAFRLLAALPDLPARSYLARGEVAYRWMDTPPADDDDAAGPDAHTPKDWLALFLAALPDQKSRVAAAQAFERLVAADGRVPEPARLREAGERLFRRSRSPLGGVLAHLACIAGDLMQLRGELCVRLVLGGVPDKRRAA